MSNNLVIKQQILEKIKEYQKIIIFRHLRPDGDATGSTLGFRALLRLNFPEKEVRVINSDYAEYVKFLGEEDCDMPDEFYSDALGVIIDTATSDRISNKKYTLCKELIKIDHHIPVESYAGLEWVEESRCSASELIADFYDTFKAELRIDSLAATCIFAGIVTDSGRFRFREVSGESMRLAGVLLDVGIDTETLYARLYLKEFDLFKFESHVYKKMKRTPGGVTYLFVDKKMQEQFNLSMEDASASVSLLDSIKGSLIWLAFIENNDGSIRVRLRSRFVTVSELANRYNGGGHACAAGATVYSKKEMKKLINEADALLQKYKQENEGWL